LLFTWDSRAAADDLKLWVAKAKQMSWAQKQW
jgi:hypothetical protein